jgi:hypothetical protein
VAETLLRAQLQQACALPAPRDACPPARSLTPRVTQRLLAQVLSAERQRVIAQLRLALPLHWKKAVDARAAPDRPRYVLVCGAVLPVDGDFSSLSVTEVSAGLGCAALRGQEPALRCCAVLTRSLVRTTQPYSSLRDARSALPWRAAASPGQLQGAAAHKRNTAYHDARCHSLGGLIRRS